MQDRGLDRGCFAVCWGMSWVETAGALQGALRAVGAHRIGLMSGFWRGGTISTRITLSPLSLSLSLYLSLSLHSPLLFISGERFSIYGPLLDHSNLESTAIPIRIVASGTSTITALPITPNLTPESPKQNSCLFTLW